MEHFIDTHSASRKCMFNLNVLENKQCTHSILQGLKVMEQWSFASGDIFLLFSLIFLYYYFFSPFFGTLIGKSLKSMDIWKMLSWNKLQKQLQVYGSIKFDRVMVEPYWIGHDRFFSGLSTEALDFKFWPLCIFRQQLQKSCMYLQWFVPGLIVPVFLLGGLHWGFRSGYMY